MDKIFEALQKLLGEEILTEETKSEINTHFDVMVNEKAKTIAETATKAKEIELEEKETALVEKETQLEEKAKVELEEFKTELVAKLDEYMEYSAKEFFEENEVAITSEKKVELAEKLIEGQIDIFKQFGITVDPDKIETLDRIGEELKNSKDEINEITKKLLEAEKIILSKDAKLIFSEKASAFTEVQKKNIEDLMEGLDYSTVDDYTKKLEICIERIVPTENNSNNLKNDEDLGEERQTTKINARLLKR